MSRKHKDGYLPEVVVPRTNSIERVPQVVGEAVWVVTDYDSRHHRYLGKALKAEQKRQYDTGSRFVQGVFQANKQDIGSEPYPPLDDEPIPVYKGTQKPVPNGNRDQIRLYAE